VEPEYKQGLEALKEMVGWIVLCGFILLCMWLVFHWVAAIPWDRELWAERASWWSSRPHCICRSTEHLLGIKNMCANNWEQDLKCKARYDK
jgi:hypothetical protein